MVASFLPLPMDPLADFKRSASPSEMEKALAHNVRSADEARYENALWWRNVNRIMSFVGLFIIGAIVSYQP